MITIEFTNGVALNIRDANFLEYPSPDHGFFTLRDVSKDDPNSKVLCVIPQNTPCIIVMGNLI